MTSSPAKPTDSFEYYLGTIYWNNFDSVLCEQNKQISGDPSVSWQDHFLKRYGPQVSAFVFGCGNGWVERDLFKRGIIKNVHAIDIMQKYIHEARSAAEKIGLVAEYSIVDTNYFKEENLRCDLVVNVGAMHHVTYINRMTEIIARVAENGLYVGFDYTGAHRNQYSWAMWSKVIEINQSLPEKYRIRVCTQITV